MAKLITVMALVLATSTTTSSATTIEDKPGLYAACAPMDLVVESLRPKNTRETSLTTKAIVNAAEARLRAARLFAPLEKQNLKQYQYLYINVNIVDRAFGIDVELKRALDLGYGFPGLVAVWDTGSVGTHGGDGQYILSVVSKYLDEFLASYLRVNEAACSR